MNDGVKKTFLIGMIGKLDLAKPESNKRRASEVAGYKVGSGVGSGLTGQNGKSGRCGLTNGIGSGGGAGTIGGPNGSGISNGSGPIGSGFGTRNTGFGS